MRLRELTIKYAPLTVPIERPQAASPAAAARILKTLLDPEPAEIFGLLLLNAKYHVLAWHPLTRGTLNSTVVEPRDVFRVALLANAVAVIAAHNHPSGDPSPSPDDRRLTDRLTEAGRLIGVDVTDHIIMGGETGRYFSFREAGLL
jgi:DNA repair protein RadC